MHTMNEIAAKLVENCRNGNEAEGLDTLYADDAVSVEAMGMGGQSPVSEGLAAIRAKHDWWKANVEVHSSSVEGPFPHGDDRFAVIFEADTTMKDSGARVQMREVAVYHVADGKIVREEFFYAA